MNNENNNLNGVVLGNVSNEVPVGNPPMPESNVVNPVDNSVIEPSQVVNPNQVVMPQQPNPAPNPVAEPAQNVAPQVASVPPVTEAPVMNNVPPVQPQVAQPEPAYTSIPQNSMPGFESSIGTNPPISLESEKEPKKKTNKTLFVIIVLLLLAAVGLGTYYVLNYTDLLTKKDKITIVANNLTFNVGDTLSSNINDYATVNGTSTTNCTLDTSKVDMSTAGIYKYTITCSNTEKEGTITIVDEAPLSIELQTVYAVKNDTLEAKDFVKNPSAKITYEFADEEAVKDILKGELGTYTVKINASNASGKTASEEATLVLMEHKLKGYSICTSTEQAITNATMTKSVKLAIVDDGNNGYGNIAFEIYKFKYSDESAYAALVTEYDSNKTLTINEITGDVELNDENLTISISKKLDSTATYTAYGNDNLKNYSTIRTYFTQTLGYSCIYEKVDA